MEKVNQSLKEILNRDQVLFNLSPAKLVEAALIRGEALLTDNGALCATTGKYTGRSPKDKFIVDEPSVRNQIAWGSINQPISQDTFELLYNEVLSYLGNKELFVFDGFAGADASYRLPLRVINEYAWQNLFVHQLFVRPTDLELSNHEPQFTVICAPGFKASPSIHGTKSEVFIVISFERKTVLIGGTQYAGEMKKSIFTQ